MKEKGPSFLSEEGKKLIFLSFLRRKGTSKRPSITGFAPSPIPLLPPLQSQGRKMNEEGEGIEGRRKKNHIFPYHILNCIERGEIEFG